MDENDVDEDEDEDAEPVIPPVSVVCRVLPYFPPLPSPPSPPPFPLLPSLSSLVFFLLLIHPSPHAHTDEETAEEDIVVKSGKDLPEAWPDTHPFSAEILFLGEGV